MKTKRSSTRLLCYVLCVLLLSSSMFLTGAVPADVSVGDSLPLANVPDSADSSRSMQEKNIIWYVQLAFQDADQSSLSFTASYNAAFLRLCAGIRAATGLAYNGTQSVEVTMNSENTVLNDIEYSYTGRLISNATTLSGTSLASGYYKPKYEDVLLECRFFSHYALDPAHFTISDSNGLSLFTNWILIGDVNKSGSVDDTDADLVLEHSVKNEEELSCLDYRFKMAADVNEDGYIDATDALLISQYKNGLIDSFWEDFSSPATLPTEPTEGIVSGEVYTFQNDYNDNGIATPNSTSGTAVRQVRYNANSATQQFKIVYQGNGEYEIQRKSNASLVWAKSSGNELIQQTKTSSPSSAQRWYILKNSNGTYTLVNKANTAYCLTAAGMSNTDNVTPDGVSLGTSTVGNRWRLCLDIGRVSYDYYNASFALRYQGSDVVPVGDDPWLLLNQHPVRLISDARAEAAKVFGSLLGVSIKYASVLPYETTADACRVENQVGVLSNFRCTSSAAGHTHGTVNGVTLHCTDHEAQYLQFKEDYPLGSISNRVNTLWSGAYLYKEGTSTQLNRSYTQAASIEHNGSGYIHLIRLGNDGYDVERLLSTYIHEMAHRFGAPDHYHEINADGDCVAGLAGICSDVSCESFSDVLDGTSITPRPKKCEMYTSYWFWKADSTRDLYCEGCLADMQNYLTTYYTASTN